MNTKRMTMVDYVRHLTQQHTHVETYNVRRGSQLEPHLHRTRVPALIRQLWDNDVPSAAAEEGPRAGYESKPAARLDALDTAARIDIEAARWVYDLTGEHPAADADTITIVRRLHGLTASADPVQRDAIEHAMRRWWIAARVVTGWDSRAWTPDSTCPQCAERGTLRIRLADRIAACTNDACRVTWDEYTIGLLADHIRDESVKDRVPAGRPATCSQLAEFEPPDLAFLCPSCGSARCVRALGARLAAASDAPRSAVGA